MAKINWGKALRDYIVDETMSYSKLSAKYGVSETVIAERAGKEGWVALRKETLEKAILVTQQKAINSIAEINARHIQIARMLQGKGILALENKETPVEIKYARDAIQAIDSGVSIERKAAGMDSKQELDVTVGYKAPSWFTLPETETIIESAQENPRTE